MNFKENVIIDDTFSTAGLSSIFAIDLDQNDDVDIFPTAEDYYVKQGSSNFDKISWYKNTGA